MMGRAVSEKLHATTEFKAFQRMENFDLVELSNYQDPVFPTVPNLMYNPLTDDYSVLDEPEEVEPGTLSSVVHGTFGVIVVVSLARLLLLTKWRGSYRRLLTVAMGSSAPYIHNYRRLRDAFNTTEFFSSSEVKNHSHGKAAGARSSARRFIEAICTLTGLQRYSFQMSASEQNENVKGSRTYYWARDVSAAPQFDVIDDSDFVTLTDVDYYLDMPSHLAEYPRPHLLYTVQPEAAADCLDDISFTFNRTGEVEWSVKGGATYKHLLWHYGTDWFTATYKICGIPYRTVTYDVQSKRVSPHKQVILLSPMRVHTGLSAVIAHFMGRPLVRLDPVRGDFAKVTITADTKLVSVARLGSEVACTIPIQLFDSLLSTRNNSPNRKVNTYQVKSLISSVASEQKDVFAPILTDYLNNATDSRVAPVTVVMPTHLVAVTFDVPDVTDKPALVPFAAPFGVPPAFVPMKNKATVDQSIKGRVEGPREQAEKLLGGFKMTPLKQKAMAEFVRRLVPDPHKGNAYDYEAIKEKQTKPGQKKDLEDAGLIGKVSRIVKTFMKAEAYGKPTDPRNITTFNPKDKVDYAQFMYPLMDHMKQFPFYAFGRTPIEVARRVAKICMSSKSVDCPDITRMDGYVNIMCRMLEKAVGLRFFRPEHQEAFSESHARSYGNVGVSSHGMRYDQEYSRGSGEMGTSLWNTVINLFIFFYAATLKFKDFDKAWDFLLEKVIAGGDDGVAGDSDGTLLDRAGRDIGFLLKTPTYVRGQLGVNFLARVYGPDVWEGDCTSMCSLRRQMEKLHLTTAVPLSAQQKLYEKAISFSYTDANTPVIGHFCAAVIACTKTYVHTGTITRWGDDHDASVQYPNDPSPWMMDVVSEELPHTDVSGLIAWFESNPTVDALLCCPNLYEDGREYKYVEDEWDVTPGMLIKSRASLSSDSDVPNSPKSASVRFGSEGEITGDEDFTTFLAACRTKKDLMAVNRHATT